MQDKEHVSARSCRVKEVQTMAKYTDQENEQGSEEREFDGGFDWQLSGEKQAR